MPRIKQKNMDALTAIRLREVLRYDPDTGVFVWRISLNHMAPAGTVAGSVVGNYRGIGIDGIKYYCHRLAWLYMMGEWPAQEVDHRNCIGSDNRWENLREASSNQNKYNARPHRNTASGVKGVSRTGARSRKPWQAQIRRGDTRIMLGHFDTIEEAHAAYATAASELHGDFARTE